MPIDFYQQPDQTQQAGANPAMMRQMAQMLMNQGAPQQGQMAGGQYIPPSALSYVNQLAGGIGQGLQTAGAMQSMMKRG